MTVNCLDHLDHVDQRETEEEQMDLLDDDESGVVDIEDGSSLDFLQSVYRDPCQPISRRMRAAVAALPFEHPKLAVTATLGPNSGFAARLETAIKRSRGDLVVIDAGPNVVSIDGDHA